MAAVDLSKLEFSAPFYGDDRDAENGFHCARELQKAAIVYDDAAHPKIIKIWALTFEGEAKAWWKDTAVWAGKDKNDIEVVVETFEEKWPAPSAAPKKQHEKMAEFMALTLMDEEVGRKHLDNLGAETTRHAWFVKELRKKAFAAGDTSAKNLMLPQALLRLPPRLCKAIGDTCVDIQSWDELITKTEAVSRAKIDQVVADEKKEKALEERLAKVEGRTPEPAAIIQQSIDSPGRNSSAPPYQRPFTPNAYPFLSPTRPPRTPVPIARLSAPTISVDPLDEVAPLTNKVIKLNHENTIQGWKEFQQAQRDWDEKWGANMLPIASRPYPLQPGGVEIGGAGCWKCGRDEGHFGNSCPAPESDHVSPKEAHWRQTNLPRRGPSQPPRTPVTIRSRTNPTGFAPVHFPTPRTPGTPSPAFRRQGPPHISQPNFGNVLMVVDAEGNVYGEIDAQQFEAAGDWAESGDYNSGNGSGSNGN
ncbi:hypothetical protein C8R46DRAFT_1234786 [Mycena filopes]|nr:hypothetical protein C8R46DRAFT_1234786 [Mycena filopes]